MLSRRALIGKAAVGAAAALAVGAAGAGVAATRAVGAATKDPADGRDGSADGRDGSTDGRHGPLDGRDGSVAGGGGEGPNAAPPPADAAKPASPPPWELVSPLAAGSMVAHGWRLGELSTVRDGSCVVTLQNARGRSHRIHVCRRDGTPQGLVYTRRLDLVVMNGGQGDLATEEGLAQAVAALAHVVAGNEAWMPERFYAELLPHAERLRRFAATDGTPAMEGKLR